MTFDAVGYRNQTVIADGDWREEFRLRGWEKSTPPERVNLQRPDIVRDVAAAFLDAGARVLVTNTAGANAAALAEAPPGATLKEEELAALNREGAAILCAVVSEHHAADTLVLGAVGPTERLLLLEEITEAALYDAWASQAEALAAGGADAILCQGFTEIRALSVAVRAARAATDLPVFGSLVFGFGPEQTETSLGGTVPQACAVLSEAGAAGAGCEGRDNPDSVLEVVKLMRQTCDLPIWVRVPAGHPQLHARALVYPEQTRTVRGMALRSALQNPGPHLGPFVLQARLESGE